MAEAGLERVSRTKGRGLWERFSRWIVSSPVVWIVVGVNLASAVAGYWIWYGDEILSAPWYYWVFIPDSPLAVTLMAGALVAYHYGRRWDLLGLLAAGTCIKYGLWTVLFWFTDYLAGAGYSTMAIIMSLSHLCMVVEGLALTTFLRFRLVPLAVAAFFLAANDVVDYASSYTPRLPLLVDRGVVARFTIALTAVIVVFWIVMSYVRTRRSIGGAARPAGGSPLDSGSG